MLSISLDFLVSDEVAARSGLPRAQIVWLDQSPTFRKRRSSLNMTEQRFTSEIMQVNAKPTIVLCNEHTSVHL